MATLGDHAGSRRAADPEVALGNVLLKGGDRVPGTHRLQGIDTRRRHGPTASGGGHQLLPAWSSGMRPSPTAIRRREFDCEFDAHHMTLSSCALNCVVATCAE